MSILLGSIESKVKNLRLRRKDDNLPLKKEGESVYNYIRNNGGGEVIVYGNIGRGDKIHKLIADYIPYKGDNVIVSYYSVCGSESYKNMSFINLDASSCNCQKCLKNKL